MLKQKSLMLRAFVLCGVVGLAACSSSPEEEAMVTLEQVEDAVCVGEHAAAELLLDKTMREPGMEMGFHMIRGYNLEMGGSLMQARPIYNALAKAQSMEEVELDCGDDEPRYMGSASMVASDRLAAINAHLADLDVTGDQLLSMTALRPAPKPKKKAVMTETMTPLFTPKPKMVAPPAPTAWAHLASYKSTAMAEKGWAALMKKYNSALGDKKMAMVRSDLGKKGIYYRVGAFVSDGMSGAKALCRTMKSRGQYCVAREAK